jgi:hypothetical protein
MQERKQNIPAHFPVQSRHDKAGASKIQPAGRTTGGGLLSIVFNLLKLIPELV